MNFSFVVGESRLVRQYVLHQSEDFRQERELSARDPKSDATQSEDASLNEVMPLLTEGCEHFN